MAHPKRRHSHARSAKRLTHYKIAVPLLVECKQCRKLKPAHMICPFCGYYASREVVKVEFDKKDKKKAS